MLPQESYFAHGLRCSGLEIGVVFVLYRLRIIILYGSITVTEEGMVYLLHVVEGDDSSYASG